MLSTIAITPGHCLDPQIAIAACRAGETGIVDLGYREPPETMASVINKLAFSAGKKGHWGVRWDTLGNPSRALDGLSRFLPQRVPVLIIGGLRAEDLQFPNLKPRELATLKKKVKGLARQIFVEVNDLQSAQMAVTAGCDGLIIKGHEAGGWVSQHSSYILLQEFCNQLRIPYWVQGGIGINSCVAAVQSGAAGVVLCEQLWLADESPFANTLQSKTWSHLDGSEAVLFGPEDRLFRLFSRSGRTKLKELEQTFIQDEPWEDLLYKGLSDADDPLLPMGQDIAFAGALAKQYGSVGRILAAMRANIDATLQRVKTQHALSPGSPLAIIHGTRYPIVQGPMTRVSDTARFAQAVVDGGGLPFVALAVMPRSQVHALLTETKALLGDRPWGVGILGFMPLEQRQEQLAVVREVKPPFAIIAGGRPSQARELEALGISSYLHVPSPGLLQGFIKEGARKFIFEGSECGGHTGPRTSFILWEAAIGTLTKAQVEDPESFQILFAGGIHDAQSASMVATLAAPLVARGMKVGVIMGTAYLFTDEIVQTGAVLKEFQSQAIDCQETSLLQSGIGIYTRCAKTPFCDEFNRTRRNLMLAQESDENILKLLELLNIGRLRIASKGVTHNSEPKEPDGSDRYLKVDAHTQRREGMYMLGEVARLRKGPLTIAELHAEISEGSDRLLTREVKRAASKRATPRMNHEDIAIVGMACMLPKAPDLRTYWENILNKVDAIREVSEDRWRPEDFFDPKRGTQDKVYSKWGGFLDDIQFDPTLYGITPASLSSIEPMQLLALDIARYALKDAGFDLRPFPRERTATIFAQGGMNDLGTIYIFRTLLAQYLPKVPGLSDSARDHIMETLYEQELPKYTEDSFPGILGNVVAGRVANRLDLQGANFVVDAACAASMAAVDAGIRQLRSGDADVALVGAVDGNNNATSFMNFAQTHALSPRGRCRSFDDSADGIALGEGVAALVLRRLTDAERDGDRIHAVIKGIGSSSDGRNRSMTAPHPQGQLSALNRAYQDAGVNPTTVGLIEAHATGTAVGDRSEIESLHLVFGNTEMARQSCAVGSVKSMIGHTKVTAGLAGIIKSVLALEHRILPPTMGVDKPNSRVDFANSPFYVNTESRPWLSNGHPRRCGVSAFGFGGTNFHAVLEEYAGIYRNSDALSLVPRPAEPFVFWGPDRARIEQDVEQLRQKIVHPEFTDLAQLAYSVHAEQSKTNKGTNGMRKCRLALLATSTTDLRDKLALSLKLLADRDQIEIRHPQGLYYQEGNAGVGVCFLFPGQGSQKINMLRDLITSLPELYPLIEKADALTAGRFPESLSRFIYPLPVFSDEDRAKQQVALNETRVAQPALAVVELAALEILKKYGLRPDYVAGHSFGEYTALCAAGVIGPEDLIRIAETRGRLSAEAGTKSPGSMAAVDTDEARIKAIIEEQDLAVHLANLNAPDQTIIAGPNDDIDAATAILTMESLRVTRLPVSAAFHSPAMTDAAAQLAEELASIAFQKPQIPVFSNNTTQPYPADTNEARELLAGHMTESVRFVDEINHLHDAGARIFIEVGPGQVISGLVDKILADRPHATLGMDVPGRHGWVQLAHLLTRLFSLGIPVDFNAWFEGRGLVASNPEEVFAAARAKAEPHPMIWRVNGARAVRWSAPEKIPPANTPESATKQPERQPASPTQPRTQHRTAAATPSLAQTSPPAHGANFRLTSKRRLSMSHNQQARPSETPSIRRTGSGEGSNFTQIQRNLTQFIELQREQQMTLRCFLDFQSSLIGAETESFSDGSYDNSQYELPQMDEFVQPAARQTAIKAKVPILPQQILDAHSHTGMSGGTPQAAPIANRPTAVSATPPAARSGNAENPDPAPDAAERLSSAAEPSVNAPVILPKTEQFKADLLQAVSERTGYPEDMLDLEAHMEADLGIDSIKRIEVFSHLKDRYNFMEGRDEETVFEELAGHKTLNEIINWYDGLSSEAGLSAGAATPKKAQTPSSMAETVESQILLTPKNAVQRFRLTPVPVPLAETEHEQEPYATTALHTVLFGPDTVLSETFKNELIRQGYTVHHVFPGTQTRLHGEDRVEVDFSSLESSLGLKELLSDSGCVTGTVINISAMDHGENSDVTAHLNDARNLFLLCKVLEQDLKDDSHGGGGWLINVSAFDGRFGLGTSKGYRPGSGATHGIAKTLNQEWTGVRVKCMDIDLNLNHNEQIALILSEWHHPQAVLETGYDRDGRWHLELQASQQPAPVPATPLQIDRHSVLLVTGGAYGITANIAKTLAGFYQPRLILVGRSPMPGPESPETRDIVKPAELKQFLIKDLRTRSAGKVRPADVEREFNRILKDREIRANLAAMQAAGATVDYHALDLRDGQAFGDLIDSIYATWGRLDGVLHGAGIIEDKLIRDKPLSTFEAVYQTKVTPAHVMADKLRHDSLKFLVFFSSIAGRFGNAGQCDYSAANEELNKLADSLKHRWPDVHTVAINWGPWDAGMVSSEILNLFAARNIKPIPLHEGTRLCIDELAEGQASDSEVLITASLNEIIGLMGGDQIPDPQVRKKTGTSAQISAA